MSKKKYRNQPEANKPWEIPESIAMTGAAMLLKIIVASVEQAIQLLNPFQSRLDKPQKEKWEVMYAILVHLHHGLMENLRTAGLLHLLGMKEQDENGQDAPEKEEPKPGPAGVVGEDGIILP